MRNITHSLFPWNLVCLGFLGVFFWGGGLGFFFAFIELKTTEKEHKIRSLFDSF